MAVRFPTASAGALALLIVSAVALALTLTGSAQAADRIYWSNIAHGTISYANLDGSGGGSQYPYIAGPTNTPAGLALDPATNSIYWANYGGQKIMRGNLDGSGTPTALNTAGATVAGPLGLAIDPARNSVYWANFQGYAVSRANLDGSGEAMDLTVEPQPGAPAAMVIDRDSNALLWANALHQTLSGTILDPGTSFTLPLATEVVGNPLGVAVDLESRTVYWSNTANQIKRSQLNGSEAATLNTAGATPQLPGGVAIDPDTNSVYWTGYGGTTISRANLDGSGGGADLNIAGTTTQNPMGIALLKAPAGIEPPTISGPGKVGQELTCIPAAWKDDMPSAHLYRAPAERSYQWLLNGDAVPGAVEAAYTPLGAGSYTCRERAANHAGSTSQTSEPMSVTVPVAGFSATPLVQDFGQRDVEAGATDPQDFVVSNDGDADLSLNHISLQGPDAAQFTIAEDGCGAVLPAAGSCVVEVAFDPTSAGEKSASLRFNHTGPSSPSSVTVTGTGTVPAPPPPGPGPGPGLDPGPGGPGGPSPWVLPDLLPSGALATIASTRLSVKRGRAPVSLRCAGRGTCSGTVKLRTAKRVRVGASRRKRLLALGSKRYRIPAGTTKKVNVKLGRKARRLIGATRKVKVVIAISPPSAAPFTRDKRNGTLSR